MIINGKTTTRDDGTERVIGYGIDSNGNVTGKFALTDGSDWDAPDATTAIEVVASMDKLPSIDAQYFNP